MKKMYRFIKQVILSIENPRQGMIAVIIFIPWMLYTIYWLLFEDDGD